MGPEPTDQSLPFARLHLVLVITMLANEITLCPLAVFLQTVDQALRTIGQITGRSCLMAMADSSRNNTYGQNQSRYLERIKFVQPPAVAADLDYRMRCSKKALHKFFAVLPTIECRQP
jgi:hypothetical protein